MTERALYLVNNLADDLRAHAPLSTRTSLMTLPMFFSRLARFAAVEDGLALDDRAALLAAALVLGRNHPLGARGATGLAAVADELRAARANTTQLLSLVPEDSDGRPEELRRVLTDVVALETQLRSKHTTTTNGALTRACEKLLQQRAPGWLRDTHLAIAYPLALTDLQIDTLLACTKVCAAVEVHFPLDLNNSGVFLGAEAVIARFEAAAHLDNLAIHFVEPEGSAQDETPRALCHVFFSSHTAPHAQVHVIRTADRRDEVQRVAGMVAHRLQHEPDARIAVCMAAGDSERVRFADALSAFGFGVRTPLITLDKSPAARCVLEAMTLLADGAPRDRLLSFMAHPVRTAAVTVETAARVYRVLRRVGAMSDAEDSAMPRGGYRHRLTRYLHGLDQSAEAERAVVNEAQNVVAATLSALGIFGGGLHPLVAALRFIDEACQDGPGFELMRVREAVQALVRDSEMDKQLSLHTAARVLGAVLAGENVHTHNSNDGAGVDLLAPQALWGTTYDDVWIVGAEEGRFGTAPPPSGFVTDADRVYLNPLLKPTGARLRFASVDAETGRPTDLDAAWLWGVFAAAQRMLVVTCAERDDRGRELSPATFFLDLQRAVPQREPPPEATTPRAQRIARVQAMLQPGASADDEQHRDIAANTREQVQLLVQCRDERARFFMRRGTPPLMRAAPYAFAVDAERLARMFGGPLGLSGDHALTPTRLEALAACRMHGFVAQVQKTDTEPPAGQAVDARVIGTLAHSVLERFFMQRRDRGMPPTPLNAESRAELSNIIDEEAAPYIAGRATGHRAAIVAQIAWLKTAIVRAVSMQTSDIRVEGVAPSQFEVNIGTRARGGQRDERVFAPVPVRVGDRTLYVGGVIDRIDEGPRARVVIDYKTASTNSIRKKAARDALFETHFQLLLYHRLLEHHLPTRDDVALHGYLVSVKDGTASDDIAVVPDLRARILDDARPDSLAANIGRVVLPILDGVIPPDAGEGCDTCRLQRVCRVPLVAEYASDLDDLDDSTQASGNAP